MILPHPRSVLFPKMLHFKNIPFSFNHNTDFLTVQELKLVFSLKQADPTECHKSEGLICEMLALLSGD